MYLRGPLLLPVLHLVAGGIPAVSHSVRLAVRNTAGGLGSWVSTFSRQICLLPCGRGDFRLSQSAPHPRPAPSGGLPSDWLLGARQAKIGAQWARSRALRRRPEDPEIPRRVRKGGVPLWPSNWRASPRRPGVPGIAEPRAGLPVISILQAALGRGRWWPASFAHGILRPCWVGPCAP